MNVSPLVILRLGSVGAPSGREVARRIGVSHNAVSMFEQGRSPLSSATKKKYARALRSTAAEVERRWMLSRLEYFERQARRARTQLRKAGMRPRRGNPVHAKASA
jgi:transcriptional regulator with XRE-family HTH domain